MKVWPANPRTARRKLIRWCNRQIAINRRLNKRLNQALPGDGSYLRMRMEIVRMPIKNFLAVAK